MNNIILHPQKDLDQIKKLRKGQFAIPNLEWDKEVQLLVGKNTLNQMKTNMINHGHKYVIDYANEKLSNEIQLESLERLINNEIKSYIYKENLDKLKTIFHLIQLWGGNAGRLFYFKGKICFNEYERLITKVLTTNDVDSIVNELKLIIKSNNTSYLNIAFITKHVSLWQRFGTELENSLPIYDSIIAKNLMGIVVRNKSKWDGFTNNDWKNLNKYWKNMINVSNTLNISTSKLERQVFNYFREDDWERNYGNI